MVQILYEDNHILVCVKPKGVLSQSDGSDKPDMLTILKNYIKEKYNKPGNVYLGLVHRLDINTSGVMVFAKTSKAAARLSDAIKMHEFQKRYKAVVEGTFDSLDTITLTHYIYKDEREKKSYIREGGQKSILEYTPIKSYKIQNTPVTLVEIGLMTGRFHQIRCQMSYIGHPLYGDKKYGSKNTISAMEFPLCAYSISFPHPTTKEVLTFSMEE
jgi:23S rRNA pseudouridine1911/1915/1917 synthase